VIMNRDKRYYEGLLPHCKSDDHKARVMAMIMYGDVKQASDQLGIQQSRMRETLNRIAASAYEAMITPKALTYEGNDRIVGIIGDTHEPYTHPDYRSWVHDIFDKNGVNYVIHIGDLIDHHALSFHDSEPALKGAQGEYIDAMDRLEPWKKTFDQMTLVTGNHDLIPRRQIKKLGLNPDMWMRPLSQVYDFPRDWVEVDQIELDGVIYHHGHTALGVNGFRNDAKARMQNSVSGHCHSNLGISYTASYHRLVWGMAVGCGVDIRSMAFAYGKDFKNRPILGCGVVKWGVEPHVFAMNLGEH
jgi:predicted phosphodiesterase